jgi:hypothetical protein
MTNIELPRSLEAYFAFAELPANERGRHFAITFTYMEAGRADRLQWWWHVSASQQRGGDAVLASLREEAIRRFRQHIERWLVNSSRRLTGGTPFPLLETISVAMPAPYSTEAESRDAADEAAANIEVLRQYARRAAGT